MTYLSSNQLKQYEDEGFVSPINIFSKEKAKEIRNEIELIENNMPQELENSGRYNAHLISFLNNKSIEDFEKKMNQTIEPQRFRGNIHVDGMEAWEERNWIGKIIEINNISFKVEKNIPRCVAINLKPNSDDNSFDLLKSLKKTYNHFDMGVYLTALDDGQVNIGDNVSVK